MAKKKGKVKKKPRTRVIFLGKEGNIKLEDIRRAVDEVIKERRKSGKVAQ